MRCADATPPRAAPTPKLLITIDTRNERRPSGQYSEARVIALGRAPPSPRPVTNRSRVSIPIEGAKAEARLATPKKRTVRARIARRPSRSASGPKAKAPIMSPKSPAPNSGASCAGVAPHSARMAGAMNPMAMVSKPSKATTRKHRTRSRTWTWDSPRASMNRWTSIGWSAVMIIPSGLIPFVTSRKVQYRTSTSPFSRQRRVSRVAIGFCPRPTPHFSEEW